MNQPLPKQDFEPASVSGPGLGYLDIPAPTDHMCFTQGSTNSLSTIPEAPTQPSSYLSLIPPPPVTPYSPEGGHYYSSAPPVFPGLDVRPRLGSNSTSSPSGMAHAPRSTTLPHPGSHLGAARDIYATGTPSFNRRQPDHHFIPRSPSFPSRRPHLSPTNSPASYASLKMDSGFGSKSQQNIPPLGSLTQHGHLSYADQNSTPIKVDINGIIDKGFFLADNEWTCYRRNYFSCICSFSLSPVLPHAGIQFQPTGSTQAHTVFGFAMCISAVVADNDNHSIELVQHTPKRDKGPIAKPEKVRLSAKPQQATHHPLALYGPDGGLASSRPYDQGFGAPPQNSAPTEHTFERIQFKQATANNGKRRAAQQYYHLIVELWADVGQQQGSDSYIKVAHKKSAKMIVRGRSPGHYQPERRGSTSSGPGGSGGGSVGGGFPPGLMGPGGEYSTGSSILQGGYPSYDPRSNPYGGTRHHHELTMEPMISADEVKAIAETKGYQYYPATIYESEHDPRHHQHHPVELFTHSRHDASDSGTNSSMSTGFDPAKVKPEMEGLPSIFYPPQSYYANNRCSRFEGKPSSAGHYPTLIPPPSSSSAMNMT